MSKSHSITKDRIFELFEIPEDGVFIWKADRGSNKTKGKVAGNVFVSKSGTKYRYMKIDGKNHKAHQLVFFLYHGYVPKEIDHIDGDGLNNCITNLRPASRSDNMKNQGVRSDNKVGTTGIWRDEQRNRWQAYIKVDKKQIHLGRFKDLNLAIQARKEAEIKYFGEWSRNYDTP